MTDFAAFMGNQGFQSLGHRELSRELERRKYKGERDDSQGLLDGPFLEACARTILERRRHYTAHILTTTSHPPCSAPAFFQSRQTDQTLRTFQYVDSAVRRFVDILEQEDPGFAETLLVISGDHARPTKVSGLIDTLRVPLILLSPALSADGLVGTRKEWGSQLDVLPTVLDLIDGTHAYAGIGQSLLRPRSEWRALTTRSGESLYFRGPYLLVYRPLEDEARLQLFRPEEPNPRDVEAEYQEIEKQMVLESLAIQQTVRRLGRSRRIFPIKTG